MARLACGGTNADWVYKVDAEGDAQPDGGVTATFWDALDGGNQYTAAPDPDDGTGLVDGTGTGISQVTLDANGFLPEDSVYTPDGVTRMAIDASGGTGPRRWIYPNDPVALSLAATDLAQQAQDTADAALAAGGGGGGGAVQKVAGIGPDATGNVPLTAGAVGAVKAGPGNSVALGLLDQFLRVDIADEDNQTSPNRREYWFQQTLVNWLNEYAEQRLRAARDTTTPLKVTAHSPNQSANLAQWEDSNRNPLSGVRSDGRLFAPNVGNARTSAGTTAPLSPAAGDIWIDTSQSPPVLRVYDGSVWIVPSGAGGGVTPAAAPAFIDATTKESGGGVFFGDKPAGDTLLACLAWNTTDPMTTVPDGWTLVDEQIGAGGRSGVWIANGAVADATWQTSGGNVSGVLLGYQAAGVGAHAALLDDDGDNVHTAPDLGVGTVPATVVRFFWDKTSVTEATVPELPETVTQRGLEAPADGSVCTIVAADAEQDTAGAAGTIDAVYKDGSGNAVSANNAGGYTIALISGAGIVQKSNTFEGGTDGTAISAANSGDDSGDAFDVASGQLIVYTDTDPIHGTMSMTTGGATVNSYVGWTDIIGSRDTVYFRYYLRIDQYPASTVRPASLQDDNDDGALWLSVNDANPGPEGTIAIEDGDSSHLAVSTTQLQVDTKYRVEVKCEITAQTITARLYLDRSLQPLEEWTATGWSAASKAKNLNFGQGADTSYDFSGHLVIDDVAYAYGGWVGP